jgi:hypothetical protein
MMIRITFSMFADFMLLGTVPLMVGLGSWEHHLKLTETDHMLVQFTLVLIVYGWAYLWNSLRIRGRLIHSVTWIADEMEIHNIKPGITNQEEAILISGYSSSHLTTTDAISNEFVERYHVSSN